MFERKTAVALFLGAAFLCGAGSAALASCGPFSDVSDVAFCPFVLEIFTLGITTGTTPSTYDPSAPVSRLQMAAFLSRTVDQTLNRSSERARMGRFWTTKSAAALALTSVGAFPVQAASDGLDVWVSNYNDDSVSRVRAANGDLLATWTGATSPRSILIAMGRVFIAAQTSPGRLYRIDPTLPAGSVTTLASNLGPGSEGIAFDGAAVWTANNGFGPNQGSVSKIEPGPTIPWTVLSTVTAGFDRPIGALYDGANVWVTDFGGKLFRLDSAGGILQTVTVGVVPGSPLYDGANIWVPNIGDNTVSLVRASNGTVLKTLTGNGLDGPLSAAFDGGRVLVVSQGGSVSLWKAADASPLGSVALGDAASGACSDGTNFWITLLNTNKLARF
jgi:DNA-binding beta-propeller fold protein YncE